MINLNTPVVSLILIGTALFGQAAEVQADSLRIQWNNNGHFYQRFDQQVTWANAKKNCETQGANLATITSAAENGFIYNTMGVSRQYSFHWLGGSDSVKEGTFTWVTGEKWVYQNLAIHLKRDKKQNWPPYICIIC